MWYGIVKCVIRKIQGNYCAYIIFDNGALKVKLSQLKPYVESKYKFNIGDIVKFRNNKTKRVVKRYTTPYDEKDRYIVTTLEDESPIYVSESDLDILEK